MFLKNCYYLRESVWNSLLEKKSLTTVLVFVLFKVLICMVVHFWYFPQGNVTSWREHALHFNVRHARITINAFYGRNSHFLCFGENLSQSLMGENVKFVLIDVKATSFSGSKRRDERVSILVPLASQSNIARNAA